MTEVVAFLAGTFAGTFIALFVISLCIAAKRGDNQCKSQKSKVENPSK